MDATLQQIFKEERIKQAQFALNTPVLCVDSLGNGIKQELTAGKVYVIQSVSLWPLIGIINDKGENMDYMNSRFKLANADTPRLGKPMAKIGTNSVSLHLGIHSEIVDIGPNYIWVRFTSAQFTKYDAKTREDLILEAYSKHAPRIFADYEIIIEALTPFEIMNSGAVN